jgi:hypothetical protein
VGQVGNELVDERAQLTELEGAIFDKPLSPSDFLRLEEHGRQNETLRILGRFAHSIFSDVTLWPKRGEKVSRRSDVIMREWTTWFCTVRDSGWKNIVLLIRLSR